jgi:hypothetical protein
MLSPETPILVLTTGGTIDKIYFDALSNYQVGETVVARLLELGRVCRSVRVEEVLRKGQSRSHRRRPLGYPRASSRRAGGASEHHAWCRHDD